MHTQHFALSCLKLNAVRCNDKHVLAALPEVRSCQAADTPGPPPAMLRSQALQLLSGGFGRSLVRPCAQGCSCRAEGC